MAGKHVSAAFRACLHAGPDLLVLVCIASHINEATGVAWPGVEELARLCKLGERRVQYALRNLQQAGSLLVEQRPGRSSMYRLGPALLPCASGDAGPGVQVHAPLEKGASPAPFATGEGVHGGAPVDRQGVHGDAPGGAQACAPGVHSGAPESEMNRNSTVSEADVGSKSKTHEVVRQLRGAGIAGAKATKQLQEAVRLGATTFDVLDAVRASEAAGDPFAYGVTVLLNRIRQSGQRAGASDATWDARRSTIEEAGVAAGLGRWDEAAFQLGRGEPFAAYTERVRVARGRANQGGVDGGPRVLPAEPVRG